MRNTKVCDSTSLLKTPVKLHGAKEILVNYSTDNVLLKQILLQVRGPPKAGAFEERPAKPTSFRKFYDRGDFPIALEHDTKGNKIAWKV